MTRRPQPLKVLSCFYILVALITIAAYVAQGFGGRDSEWIFQASLLAWALVAFCLFNALAVYQVWKVALASVPLGMVIFVFYELSAYSRDLVPRPHVMAFVCIALYVIPQWFLVSKSIRELFLNPGLRWWRQRQRVRSNIMAYVSPLLCEGFSAKAVDISEGGTFLACNPRDPLLTSNPYKTKVMKLDDRIIVRINLGKLTQLRCDAKIIRISAHAKGTYPSGIALKFEQLTRQQKKELRRYVSHNTESNPLRSL